MEDYSSDDCQYVEDLEYIDDDFCVTDIEEQKIDKLTRDMNVVRELLYKLDDSGLNELDTIKKDFYFLCENNRYLIEDSIFLQRLESNIYETISIHEDKLFKIYQELVDKEDELINKEALQKDKLAYGNILEKCGLGDQIVNNINNKHKKQLDKKNVTELDMEKDKSNNKNKKHKLQIDMEKDTSNNDFIFSYNNLNNSDVKSKKSRRNKPKDDFIFSSYDQLKDDYEEKKFKNNLDTITELNDKYNLKNIDDLNTIDELRNEYYKRIDFINDTEQTLSKKLSHENQLVFHKIKEKITKLQNNT